MAILTAAQVAQSDTPQQTATLGYLSSGAAGIRQTLGYMVSIVKQYRKNPEIRALAERIIADVPEKDYIGEIRALFNFVRDNVRYTQDIRDVETLKTPDATLFSAQGDCDDKSTLIATLCETVGFVTRFIAIGMNQRGVFEHVYAEVKLGTVWIAMDTTENVSLGWKPKTPVAYMERHV
jgi:transglutaminase-like putative cysteine protease